MKGWCPIPQSKITINAVPGSNTDLPINTLVQLNNQSIGGELTFNWSLLDQPIGAADALSSLVIVNPTFTPKKEGSYFLKLVVNQGLPTEQIDYAVAAIRQLKTRIRVPAAGEEAQADASDGWAVDVDAALQLVDTMRADPGVVVGVNQTVGIVASQVVRVSGDLEIKTGLPGAEFLPGFAQASAATLAQVNRTLGVIESGIDGTLGPFGSGTLIKVRLFGRYGGAVLAGAPVINDRVFVSDLGFPALVAGTNSRIIGHVISTLGGWRPWINGLNES